MIKQLICLLAFLFTLNSCHVSWEKTSDGVVVNLKNTRSEATKAVRLQVITPEIIRVTATPQDFSTEESLVAQKLPQTADWTVIEENGQIVLETTSLKAYVSIETGEVQFTDKEGNVILKENNGGGKSFKAINVEGTPGYEMRQVFESPADEAFYGLGQHQADEFNYKGKNEVLFQYNTKVAIPFFVSNKNYGIYWDNYSVTKFGDSREYQHLSQFKLYNQQGEEGGLTATYLIDSDSSKVFVERSESKIDYENLETIKQFPENFPFNNSTIIWEGNLQAKESGLHRFLLYYAGYTKVWIDGKLMADRWRTAWNPSVAKFNVNMQAGKRHHIKVEWQPDGGISYIGLKALSPVDNTEQNKLALSSEMGDQIDYYFIKGESMDEVMKGYRALTGKAQVMPKWSMGFWQSRERYKTQDELLGALKEFRKRRIPIDNIVLDWSYWPEMNLMLHVFRIRRRW